MVTEAWTAGTGIQHFDIIPEIRDFYPESDTFDALIDSVKINFKVCETAGYLTMTSCGYTIIDSQYFEPGTSSVYWNGREGSGKPAVPGTHPIYIQCPGHTVGTAYVTVKGTKIEGDVADLHWQPSGNPYVLVENSYIGGYDTLIIDPDVLVMGHDATSNLQIAGVLKSIGTSNDTIVFTSHRKLAPQEDSTYSGMWRGLINYGSSTYVTEIKYCLFEYADVGLEIWSDLEVKSDIIENSYLRENVLPARCDFRCAGVFGYNNEYSDNDTSKIEVWPYPPSKNQPPKNQHNIADTAITTSADLNSPSNGLCKVADMTIKDQTIPYWFRYDYPRRYIVSGSEDSVMTLIIEPGIRIEFDQNTLLEIGDKDQGWYYRGRLICEGLDNDTITLTGVGGGSWQGLQFCDTSCTADTSSIKYTLIENAGSDSAAILLGDSTSINIENCRIYESSKYSISMPNHNPCNNITIKNCLFEENSIPVLTSFSNLSALDLCSYLNNTMSVIEVLGDTQVHKSVTINYQSIPLYFLNKDPYGSDFVIHGDNSLATLTIDPGTIIKCDSTVTISVGHVDQNDRGKCVSIGNDSTSIVFTSLNPSAYWGGIQLYAYNSQDTSTFEYCEISHTEDASIQIYNTSPIIKNSVIKNSANGIIVNGTNSQPLVEYNLISLNNCGIYNTDTGSTNLRLCNNDVFGNRIAIKNELTSYNIDADSNWWGDSLGPWDPSTGLPDSNYAGKGDSIGDYVYYRPWLTEPVQHAESLIVITPNGAETLYCETDTVIRWSRTITPTRQELYYTTDFPEGGSITTTETLWQFIDTVDVNDTSYVWSIPLELSLRCRIAVKLYYDDESDELSDITEGNVTNTYIRENDYYVVNPVFKQADNSISPVPQLNSSEAGYGNNVLVDISDANFSIVDTVPPLITVLEPNGGEYFIPTREETIRWQASDNHKLDHFNICLSTDGGLNYPDTIVKDLEAPCSTYAWTPSEKRSYISKIQVIASDSSDNSSNDVSDNFFYIPVKSYSNEMSAYNNARRLIRTFPQNIYTVYTTEISSDKGDKKQEDEIHDRDYVDNNSIREHNLDQIEPSLHNSNIKDNLRNTNKIYFTYSTNMGQNWTTPFNVTGTYDGMCPSMAMNSNAYKIGVAWTNTTGSKILYRYCYYGMPSWFVYTVVDEVTNVTYSPVAIQFASDSIHLVTLRTNQITKGEVRQEVLYLKFPWTNPTAITMDTLDYWRITYDDPVSEYISLAVDYNRHGHVAWERPPGEDTLYTTSTPLDIYYVEKNTFVEPKYNVSDSDSNSIYPSIDCYGGHFYVVWQEKVNGYNVFLYKRNYIQFPPSSKTDTISQTSGNSEFAVSRMGGVVLWAEGNPAEIYGRIWDSMEECWLDVENWSNTTDNSTYPQVDAWQSEGGTDIFGGWTENTDTCGFGKKFVSFFPGKDNNDISFPSYYLQLGDNMSTPFTEHRDTTAVYEYNVFDYGADSLVYYLPYIDCNAKCRLIVELYRPDSNSVSGRGDKWKVKLDVDNVIHQMIELAPGELKRVNLDVPWLVNIDGSARIKFDKKQGDFILGRRVLFYEYERSSENIGSILAGGGAQGSGTMEMDQIFYKGISPNPTRGNLRMQFNSPDQRRVGIKLYDVTGRCVKEIFDGNMRIGLNQISVRTKKLSAGIYFIRIETDDDLITEKVIILK